VKGKPKKKSIKAAAHSRMGSKRKLSRMGKNRKKDHSGLDATFIGRAKVLRKLQLSLKDFRRLCILKGVYPREPRGRAPGNKKGQVYYHIKDVRAVAHEPVLDKFREFRSFMKKVRRAAGRNEKDEAARQYAMAPTYTLHHLVRERYPRFGDALNDLDDALTLIHLFAALPSEKDIRAKVINKAKSLAGSWSAYCATTSSITKSFISVKGVYMEASMKGSTVRWVIPHSFTQSMPEEVDYKVMLTFFEFYETLLSFVLFKLYNQLGLRYPLPVKGLGGEGAGNTSSVIANNLRVIESAMSANVGCISGVIDETVERGASEAQEKKKTSKKSRKLIQSIGQVLAKVEESEDDEEEENVEVAGPFREALETVDNENLKDTIPGGIAPALDDEATKRKNLFAGFTLFLSREVPRGYIELICLAFGGKVGWEGSNSPFSVSDPSITHHIVDRPKLPASFESLPKSRDFVQPQWVLDCANFLFLLPIARYKIGTTLPPHLSPWVDDEEEGYKPAYAEEIERLKNGESVEDVADDLTGERREKDQAEEGGHRVNEDSSADSSTEEEEEEEEVTAEKDKQKNKVDNKEAHDLAKVMMSKKAARLYGRMQHGLAQKQSKVDELKKRRKQVETDKGGEEEKMKRKHRPDQARKEQSGRSKKKSKKSRTT